MIAGIDAAAVNGSSLDWPRGAREGYRFLIARASHGNDRNLRAKGIGTKECAYRDVAFDAHVRGARAQGMIAGAYHVAFPLPHLAPAEQVAIAFEASRGLGTQADELPIVLDLEWPPHDERSASSGTIVYPWRRWSCTAAQIRQWAIDWLEEAERVWHKRPILYSYPYFLSCIEAGKEPRLATYPLWIADYRAAGRRPREIERPTVPAPWTDWTIWQHDGNHGLRLGNVDIDANVLQGDEAALAKLCAGAR